MTIEFEQESGPDLGLDAEKLMSRVAFAALDYAEFPFEAEISMLITLFSSQSPGSMFLWA